MKKRILLIDDDPDFMRTYKALFSNEFEVSTASNIKEAFDVSLTKPFFIDLIFCDIFMPEITGFEVFNEFSKNNETKQIPFMFKTSSPDKKLFEKALSIYGVEIVNTLMSNFEILQRVKRELNKSKLIKVSINGELRLVINKENLKVTYPNSLASLDLTDFEYKLSVLLSESDIPVLREDIISKIYGEGYVLTDNNFNTLLSNFRKKLSPADVGIKTIRGKGVLFC